jgi:phosphoribosyl 1,2-cyclic phosphate phosphodiesterase
MGVPTLGCECPVCASTDVHDKRLRPSVMVRWRETEDGAGVGAGLEGADIEREGLGSIEAPEKLESGIEADEKHTSVAKATGRSAGFMPGINPRPTAPRSLSEAFAGLERVVVIDTGPDFREQALREKLTRVDAVFYTHSHADHILGLDDLRPLSFEVARLGGTIPLYASSETRAVLERIYEYTFSPDATYPNRARVRLEPLGERTSIRGVEFVRVPVMHGTMEIAGFRFGSAAYLTDVSDIPESSFALLEGLDHLVVSALRYKPHPSHATVDQAIGWARRIGAKQTWLTHIAHELGHEETNRALPDGVRLAYDGLTLEVNL